MPSDAYELSFWGNCVNTFHEEEKQLVYAPRMGLQPIWDCAHPPIFDLQGRTVIDIGGGPVSLLLKCVNFSGVVLDPAGYPDWVYARYAAHGIAYWQREGEGLAGELAHFDEAWIYNVLTHAVDPAKVIANARGAADKIRIFEWVDIDPYPGHPHRLSKDELDDWLGSPGFVSQVSENGAVGKAYYGVFST